MTLTCDGCGAELLEIDVKCPSCGKPQTTTGAHRMIGTTVLGQYEIVDVLGQGGMSVVYRGRHKLTEQDVALKILPRELAAHPQVKSRFIDEAKALAQLDHPNIVHLYNFGEDDSCFVLAMQYVAGATFERMILIAEELPWFVASRVTIDVLSALEYAHGRGVIHRDMKPSNVLVREHDGSATVMDFGIAKMTNSTRLTATGQTMGTVRYMSPEQVRGHHVDARTDIYSLGATLYEAVCGDTPFDGDTHFEIMNQHLFEPPPSPAMHGVVVPPEFEEVLLRALAKSPEDRFRDAGEFRERLEALLAQAGIDHAESTRLTREALERAIAGSDPGRAADFLTDPGDQDERADDASTRGLDRRGPTAPSPTTASGRPAARGAPTGLAPRSGPADGRELEPETKPETRIDPTNHAGVDVGVVPESDAPGAEVARSRSRSVLWVALAGAVLVAAAGVVFSLERGDPPPPAGGEQARTQPRKLAGSSGPFLPPGIEFAVDRTYEDVGIRVLAPAGWDPDRVAAAFTKGHRRFVELMEKRGVSGPFDRPSLAAVIVPQRVFCDDRAFEDGEAPDLCDQREVHYRPKDRTLFVTDDLARLEASVAYGNALVICLHTMLDHCEDVVDRIDEEYAPARGNTRATEPRRRARSRPRR